MNAERKEALIPIVRGIGKSLDDYPFARALSDLHIYYQAGTFIGALQAIQKDSGVKEEKADKVLTATFATGETRPLRDRIISWLTADAANRVPDFVEWLANRVPPVSMTPVFWVDDANTSERDLRDAVDNFNIPE